MAIKSIADVVKETQDYIDKRRKGIIKSYKTGYPKFDSANLDGWEWGSAITIGARPSVGKTVFTSCLLRNSLNCNDFSDIIILEFNWEMSSRVLLLRELSADTKTSYKDVISAGNIKVTDEAFKYYNNILEKYKNMPIYYEEEPKTAKEFAATVRKFRDKYKDKKIIVRVDHTILGRKSAAESGQTEMLYNLFFEGNILKKESDIIFVWLTQLQREFETRQENGTDKAFPRQSDVFGADAAAMYSESIILLNKPSRYGISFYGNRDNGISVEQDDLFAHMVKNRNGEGDVILRYKTHFETMDIREC